MKATHIIQQLNATLATQCNIPEGTHNSWHPCYNPCIPHHQEMYLRLLITVVARSLFKTLDSWGYSDEYNQLRFNTPRSRLLGTPHMSTIIIIMMVMMMKEMAGKGNHEYHIIRWVERIYCAAANLLKMPKRLDLETLVPPHPLPHPSHIATCFFLVR